MANGEDARSEQILIVRRRGGGEDDHHHGGVWKIAYADFMTAMMAFFLVMWLVNASNTETKISVASYFNPIKLTDQAARTKGVRDATDAAGASDNAGKLVPEKKEKEKNEKQKKPSKDGSDGGNSKRQGASGAEEVAARKSEGEGAASTAPQEGGRAFRDPFNPFNPFKSVRTMEVDEKVRADALSKPAKATAPLRQEGDPAAVANDASTAGEATQVAPKKDNTAVATEMSKALSVGAERIRKETAAAVSRLGSGGPGVDVTIEGESIIVSLTDTSTFGMFAVGSAEPNNDVIKLIQNIAPIITPIGDRIIIRGHTDARPYRSEKINNNWRLAMSRAEAAHAMLVRSGIDDSRFERIEAYADRKPKIPNDPDAAANRRIEIILRKATQ